MNNIIIHPSSENSVLITWPEKICPNQHQQILKTLSLLNTELNNVSDPVVFESIASYNSIMIYYYFNKISFQQLKKRISDCIELVINTNKAVQEKSLTIEIPVYYGEEAGWDLSNVAKQCQLSLKEIITLHSQQVYRSYALGFTPGFCYLGTLNEQLVLPRKATPRLQVPKGAVAIAEQQTAVYPNSSPGGWHIIGQTPVDLYQQNKEAFTPLIQVGQQVKFTEIDKATYLELAGKPPFTEEKH
ncbi:5-oxoprolinase subunit PxpB [Colwellia sp. 1_MG-2023]|uniref:5-oxoprolinase subunit PxpB n=1 Tax=Colwellia sp. 1_MG-2023 TaxID=3062649 RepID=UPI0026E1D947|nr:5-oxoprolinase subunit PxpB [Colwellia sp. 1_MG-2023]MDO6445199.1 5-oxoprolinase subunit PxpB [Colwellia sp. 1_MG-2023]